MPPPRYDPPRLQQLHAFRDQQVASEVSMSETLSEAKSELQDMRLRSKHFLEAVERETTELAETLQESLHLQAGLKETFDTTSLTVCDLAAYLSEAVPKLEQQAKMYHRRSLEVQERKGHLLDFQKRREDLLQRLHQQRQLSSQLSSEAWTAENAKRELQTEVFRLERSVRKTDCLEIAATSAHTRKHFYLLLCVFRTFVQAAAISRKRDHHFAGLRMCQIRQCGADAFQRWARLTTSSTMLWRCSLKLVMRVCMAWVDLVETSRWISNHQPFASAFSNARLLRLGLKYWRIGAIAILRRFDVQRLCRPVFAAWVTEKCSRWRLSKLGQFCNGRYAQLFRWSCLIEWRAVARLLAKLKRRRLMLQRRLANRLQKNAFRFWVGPFQGLQRSWNMRTPYVRWGFQALRQNLVMRRIKRMPTQIMLPVLSASFRGLASSVGVARSKANAATRLCRSITLKTVRLAMSAWRVAVAQQRSIRASVIAVSRRRLAKEFRLISSRTQRFRSRRACSQICETYRLFRAAGQRRQVLTEWSRAALRRTELHLAVARINRFARLKQVHQAWMSLLVATRRLLSERNLDSASLATEELAVVGELAAALKTVSVVKHAAEARRLEFADELRLATGWREDQISRIADEYDEAAATAVASRRLADSAGTLVADLVGQARMRATRRMYAAAQSARLESQLSVALEAPIHLQSMISEHEAALDAASSQELSARKDAVKLRQELEMLHKTAAKQLADRKAVVAALSAQIVRATRS